MATIDWRTLAGNILQLVYPKICSGCSHTLMANEETLCLLCISEFPFTNYHHIANNETAQRFEGRVRFANATSLAYFTEGGLLQHLLHELKYKNNYQVAQFFGKSFASALKKTIWASDIDIIIPVPLFPKKERKRGFNQSQLIAEEMAKILDISVHKNALYRTRDTESQTKKTRAERAENMKDAFALRSIETLKNKHILLIDDVLTTSATLESCALALQKIEGIKISIGTVGIATY